MANSNQRNITPAELQSAVKRLMQEYGDTALDIATASAKKGARSAVKELKASPHERTGKYNRGWTSRTEGRNTAKFTVYVYNREAGLPHLLNSDHAAGPKRGGHYSGDGHVDKAEANGVDLYLNEVMKKL